MHADPGGDECAGDLFDEPYRLHGRGKRHLEGRGRLYHEAISGAGSAGADRSGVKAGKWRPHKGNNAVFSQRGKAGYRRMHAGSWRGAAGPDEGGDEDPVPVVSPSRRVYFADGSDRVSVGE